MWIGSLRICGGNHCREGALGFASRLSASASLLRQRLVGVRANAVGGHRMSQEVGFGGGNFGLGGVTFPIVRSKAFEHGSDVGGVGSGVGIVDASR